MNAIHATLNSQPLLTLRVELRRGAEASVFVATLAQSENVPRGGESVDIRVTEGSTRRFAQFQVTQVLDLGDGRCEIHGADVRDRWATRPVNARLNITSGDGTAWEPASINAGVPWNLAQAVAALFDTAGEAAPAIAGLAADAVPRDLSFRGASLAHALEAALASVGLSLSISDGGNIVASGTGESTFTPENSRVMSMSAEPATAPARVEIVGGGPLELLSVGDWQPVVPGDGSDEFPLGEFFPLTDVLDAWNISDNQARHACLSDAGFERLIGNTAPHAAARLSALKRHAFRSFRAGAEATARLPWLPLSSVHDGALQPPQLRVTRSDAGGAAPAHANEPSIVIGSVQPENLPFELDLERGLLHLARPPYSLSDEDLADTTFQGRALVGDPVIALTVSAASARPPARFEFGEGERVTLAAPELTAIYDGGTMLNRAALEDAAREIAARAVSQRHCRYKFAGLVEAHAGGDVSRVVVEADEHGLTTSVEQSPAPDVRAHAPRRASAGATSAVAPLPSGLHQPINAYRAGPLILRTGDGAPETESYLAVEAAHRDAKTHALELAQLGPLAHGFHIASNQPELAGRWFFVAGVEAIEGGRVRVLGSDDAHDPRHDPVSLDQLSATRKTYPRGYRGVLVSLGKEPRLVDAGPLVSDGRGNTGGDASNLVADLEGDKLSAKRAGPLHFLTVLSYSPAHEQWVPALNLREEETGLARNGRGLFAEREGRSLGRLTATNQGGPILGDARACEKHRFAQGAADDGPYIETSGHLSTESFFKVPGDAVHDAPLKFVPAQFQGGVPPWKPYEALIKYDTDTAHRWNKQAKPGLWRIEYRVPFSESIPPTWTPPTNPPVPPPDAPPTIQYPPYMMAYVPQPSIQPIVGENEIWAPSHDWVPAPSSGAADEITFPGPSLKSAGFAGESSGVPVVSLGGGAILLPPTRGISQAQADSGTRDAYFALHPEVVLAFGFPKHAGIGAGRVVSGWNLKLDANADLAAEPVDADAQVLTDKTRGFHITGHVQVGKDGATFASSEDSGALRLAEGVGEGIAFGAETKLYCPLPGVVRTDGEISAAAVNVDGKLTVGGLIDPTGLQLTAQAANPGSATTLWSDSGSSDRPRWGANLIPYSSEVQPLDGDLSALAALSGTGIAVRTAANTWAQRSIAVGSSKLTIASGDGVSGNPTLDVSEANLTLSNLGGTLSIAKGGTNATSENAAVKNLLTGGTSRTTVASTDRVAAYDGTNGGYFTLANLFAGVQRLTQDTSLTRNYKLLALDAGNNAKYVNMDDFDPTGQILICRTASYTGSGSSGKTVTLSGINRAYFIILMRSPNTATEAFNIALPLGGTGSITRRLTNGQASTTWSLDAPAAGTSQVLTINNTASDDNASGVDYALLVVGSPI